MGGPLVVVPLSAVADWGGGTMAGTTAGDGSTTDDYDRACAVYGYAGVIPVLKAEAIVLGDEPATTCFWADQRVFVRWFAADSEEDLFATATQGLADPATPWEDGGTWTCDGPAVLMDSAIAGPDLGPRYPGGSTTVPLDPGTWTIQVAAYVNATETASVGLVRLLPT
jgi:hypothetical protein